MDRPICQEKNWETREPCKHPAKFIWDGWNGKPLLVCGNHARAHTAKSLHPFRMRDWEIDQAIKLLQESETKDLLRR